MENFQKIKWKICRNFTKNFLKYLYVGTEFLRDFSDFFNICVTKKDTPEVTVLIFSKLKNKAKNYQKILLLSKLFFYVPNHHVCLGTYCTEWLTSVSLRNKNFPLYLCKYLWQPKLVLVFVNIALLILF